MSDIYIEQTHNFDFVTARTQAKQWLDDARKEFGFDATYQEGANQDVVAIKKSGVDGRAVLTADKVVFEANLGFIAKPFKGMISDGIQDGLTKYFS